MRDKSWSEGGESKSRIAESSDGPQVHSEALALDAVSQSRKAVLFEPAWIRTTGNLPMVLLWLW